MFQNLLPGSRLVEQAKLFHLSPALFLQVATLRLGIHSQQLLVEMST